MLSQVQRDRRTNLVNCSDGAKIYGAKPKVAASITLPDILPRREDVLARVEAQLLSFEAGEMLRKVDFDAHIKGCEDFVEAFDEFLQTTLREDDSFVKMEARLLEFVDERRPDFRGFFSLALSSIVSMLRLGSFFGSRISDEAKRRAFFEQFIDHYRERCIEMAEISKDLLSSVDESNKRMGEQSTQLLA
jgi:hypothetical protein